MVNTRTSYKEIPDLENLDELTAFFIPYAEREAILFCKLARYSDSQEYISYAIASLPTLCKKINNKKTAIGFVRKSLRNMLKNYLRDTGRKIRLPRPIIDLYNSIKTFKKRNPFLSDEEVREKMNISLEKWYECHQAMNLRFSPLIEIIPNSEKEEENEKTLDSINYLREVPDEIFLEMYRVYVDAGKVIKAKYRKEVELIISDLKAQRSSLQSVN